MAGVGGRADEIRRKLTFSIGTSGVEGVAAVVASSAAGVKLAKSGCADDLIKGPSLDSIA